MVNAGYSSKRLIEQMMDINEEVVLWHNSL